MTATCYPPPRCPADCPCPPGQVVTFAGCGHVQHYPAGGGEIRPGTWLNARAGTREVRCQTQCKVASAVFCGPGCGECPARREHGERSEA